MTIAKADEAPWVVGTYTPSEAFKAIPEMVCVYRDDRTTTVVALTGPAGDARSVDDATVMAASRELLAALVRYLDADCPFEADADCCECGEYGTGRDARGKVCVHIQAHRAVAKATRPPDTRTLGERLAATSRRA